MPRREAWSEDGATNTENPSALDPVRRFANRVDDYVRYRPSYPAGAVDFLRTGLGLSRESVVADVGSGTGILTHLLLETGAKVFAVEPNDAMRSAAESRLGGNPRFASVNGTAEATGLASGSVSLITCAQAFHWFKVLSTRQEFSRIAAPAAWCALIWNTTVTGKTDFAPGYERINDEFGTDPGRERHESLEKEGRFDAFFGPGEWQKRCFENHQTLSFDGLKGRLLSSSYAPKEGHPRFESMMASLGALFDRCQDAGFIQMDYVTELFYGRLE